MTEEKREMYVMISKPKGKETSAIQLSQDIWKVEDELDLLYSSAKNAYASYTDPGETGILLKIDGTLVLSYPSEKECKEKFAEMTKKLAKSTVLSAFKYDKLELERYKISKKIEGRLEDIAPKELINFLCSKKQEIQYDPKKISFEFLDPKSKTNFIKITFDSIIGKKLLLDVGVESNEVQYARKTFQKIEILIKK